LTNKISYTEFLETITEDQLAVISYMDSFFINDCQMTRKMRYRVPFYDFNKWVCYLNPTKKGMIELCFLKGKELSKIHPILEVRGRKMVAGILLNVYNDLPIEDIAKVINSAKSL